MADILSRQADRSSMHAPQTQRPPTKKSRKSFWLKQLHMWHWMSSAISLIGLLLFAVTGFTLNHAADIEGTPTIVEKRAQMPSAVLAKLGADPAGGKGVLVFEVDGTGDDARATTWRIGLPPQVDYVEGCS